MENSSHTVYTTILPFVVLIETRERLEIVATPLSRKREGVVLPHDISMKLLTMR